MNNTKSVRGFTRATVLAVAAAAGLACTTAFAADQVKVRRSADPQVTYKRLQAASAELCGRADHHNLARLRVWTSCYTRTLDGAVLQMQEPALLAIHRQHVALGGAFAG